jgi:hypothetical protein
MYRERGKMVARDGYAASVVDAPKSELVGR